MDATPVGQKEIAERAGVQPDTVKKWVSRHPGFPKPRWTVGGKSAWEWTDVHHWLRMNGRMPMHFRFRDVGGAVIEETLGGDDEWLVTAQFVSHGHDGGYVAHPGPWLLDALDGDRAEAQIVADRHLKQWCEKREQWVRDNPDEPMPKHLLGS